MGETMCPAGSPTGKALNAAECSPTRQFGSNNWKKSLMHRTGGTSSKSQVVWKWRPSFHTVLHTCLMSLTAVPSRFTHPFDSSPGASSLSAYNRFCWCHKKIPFLGLDCGCWMLMELPNRKENTLSSSQPEGDVVFLATTNSKVHFYHLRLYFIWTHIFAWLPLPYSASLTSLQASRARSSSLISFVQEFPSQVLLLEGLTLRCFSSQLLNISSQATRTVVLSSIFFFPKGKNASALLFAQDTFLISSPYLLHKPWFPLCRAVLSRSVVSDSLWPHGLQPTRFLCSWDSPGKNTGEACHALLQGIFPT